MKAEDKANQESQNMEVDEGYQELYSKNKANVPLKSIQVSFINAT